MNAKDYLLQFERMDREIDRKLMRVRMLRDMTQKVTNDYAGVCVSRTRNIHTLEDTIARIVDTEREIDRDIDRLIDGKSKAVDLIASITDTDGIKVLMGRFINGKSWKELESETGLSRTCLNNKMSAALDELQEILDAREIST